MKLIILSQYYPPEIGAPQARLSELAQLMVKQGHKVTVLTAMPNYPKGRIYQGYGGFLKREQVGGVEIIRTFIYPSLKATFMRRLSSYFSFVISSMIVGSFLLRKADYLLVESPPLFLGISAVWLCWLKRAKLIFNVSDLWPESAVRMGVVRENSLSHRISLRLEAYLYRRAWLISGQSRSILADIKQRFPDKTVFHLSNGVDTRKFPFSANGNAPPSEQHPCVAVYAGLHGLAQGLDQILEAARHFADGTLQFHLIGDGPEKQNLQRRAAQENLTNVTFDSSRPANEIPPVLASADIILIPLKTFIPGAVPSKLYEAMASGRPVIMVAHGEAAEIVNEHQAGIVVEPGDIDGFVRALQLLQSDADLRHRMGENGRRAAETLFDREIIVNRFIQHIENPA